MDYIAPTELHDGLSLELLGIYRSYGAHSIVWFLLWTYRSYGAGRKLGFVCLRIYRSYGAALQFSLYS